MRHANSYITKLISTTSLMLLVIMGCINEDPIYPNPEIKFNTNLEYVYNDKALLLNDTVVIGIISETNSNDNLVHFNTLISKDSIVTSIDSGIYIKKFEYEKRIIKGISENETWSFYTRDRDGRKSNTISIKLTLDSTSVFGNIEFLPSIVFGAQNNDSIGSFYSLSMQQVYSQTEAYNNQESIDLLYFFDLIEIDENTISSPGANIDNSVFPGNTGLTNWSERKTTRFNRRENIDIQDFDNCSNDSLILANTFEFSTGNRKAKNLASGHIFSFVTENGKRGLFKVINVKDEETGIIEISIKMQE